jgi:hypothetical protein
MNRKRYKKQPWFSHSASLLAHRLMAGLPTRRDRAILGALSRRVLKIKKAKVTKTIKVFYLLIKLNLRS